MLFALLTGLVAPLGAVQAEDAAQFTRAWSAEWPRTDFSRHSVDLAEIVSGGPPKDGIPPIDKPVFVSLQAANDWLDPEEPVLVFVHKGDARAYPMQILIWHEIANDVVGGLPVVVTFCPLCNSALVFDRRVKGQVLDFGTTGKLRHSDLVMWDRQTDSWWQQLTGEAIAGGLTGEQLKFLPAPLVAYGTFRETYPEGRVLSRETGAQRPYGRNPYVGYDDPANRQPFLFRGTPDRRLPAMERVVALELGGETKAYPYSELARAGAVNDRVGGVEVVVLHRGGTRSALDGSTIATSRDVGTGAVFARAVQGRTLNFELRDGALHDRETGTRWSLLGVALEGPLQGQRLEPVVHGNHFAFAWLAFRTESAVFRAR